MNGAFDTVIERDEKNLLEKTEDKLQKYPKIILILTALISFFGGAIVGPYVGHQFQKQESGPDAVISLPYGETTYSAEANSSVEFAFQVINTQGEPLTVKLDESGLGFKHKWLKSLPDSKGESANSSSSESQLPLNTESFVSSKVTLNPGESEEISPTFKTPIETGEYQILAIAETSEGSYTKTISVSVENNSE